jgi:hypothetical protein
MVNKGEFIVEAIIILELLIMDTQLINLEIDIRDQCTVEPIYQKILKELKKYGRPLSWIVSGVAKDCQKIYVQATFLNSELTGARS